MEAAAPPAAAPPPLTAPAVAVNAAAADAPACFLPGDPVPAMAALVREMAAAEGARTRRPSVTGGPSALAPGPAAAASSAAQRAIGLLDGMLRAADGDGTGAVDAPTFALCVRRAFPSLARERVTELVAGMHLAALPGGGRVGIADFIDAVRQLAVTPALWGGGSGSYGVSVTRGGRQHTHTGNSG